MTKLVCICDRCKKEIPVDETSPKPITFQRTFEREMWNSPVIIYDFCECCKSAFYNFLTMNEVKK